MFILSILLNLAFAGNYESCVSAEIVDDVSLEIGRDSENEMAKITISGQSTQWFAVGFGQSVMNGTYAVIGYGDTFTVEQRILGYSYAGDSSTAGRVLTNDWSNTIATSEENGVRTLTIEVPYTFVPTFQEFIMCYTDGMNVISAKGTAYDFAAEYQGVEDPDPINPLDFPAYHGPSPQRSPGVIDNWCCNEMTTTQFQTSVLAEETGTTETTMEPTEEEIDGVDGRKYLLSMIFVVLMVFMF